MLTSFHLTPGSGRRIESEIRGCDGRTVGATNSDLERLAVGINGATHLAHVDCVVDIDSGGVQTAAHDCLGWGIRARRAGDDGGFALVEDVDYTHNMLAYLFTLVTIRRVCGLNLGHLQESHPAVSSQYVAQAR
jgi:hypothetical protein